MSTLAEKVGRVPSLFYSSYFSSGYTVTASNEISGYLKENAYDGKTYTQWGFTSGATRTLKVDAGAAVSCDYLAIAYHNLSAVGASILLEHSPDNSTWTTCISSFSATAGPIIKLFTAVSKRYWRISITGLTGSGYIGVVYLGARLELPSPMPVGFTPAKYSRKDKMLTNETEGAHLAGLRMLSKVNEVKIPLKYLTAAWIDANWTNIVAALVSKPIFFLHDTTNYPTHYFVGWMDKDIPDPRYDTVGTYSVEIALKGLSA